MTLVGVVSADVGLGLADFRASERTFQLLTQVAGRAGRGERPGEAIVQTLYPEHYSIQLACRQDYPAFFEREMQFRRAMRYPPHRVAHQRRRPGAHASTDAMDDADAIVAQLRDAATAGQLRVLGPAPAPLGRLRGEYRAQFFVKGTQPRGDARGAVAAPLVRRDPDLRAPRRRRRRPADGALRTAELLLQRNAYGSIGAGVKQRTNITSAKSGQQQARAIERHVLVERRADAARPNAKSMHDHQDRPDEPARRRRRSGPRRRRSSTQRDVRSTGGRAPRTRCGRRRAVRSETG